jgi:hypothetical protein
VAVVTPLEYTALVWGVVLDFAIWHVLPAAATLLGGAIVVGAGLYVLRREAVSRRAAGAEGAGAAEGAGVTVSVTQNVQRLPKP